MAEFRRNGLLDLWICRAVFLIVFCVLSYHVQPFELEPIPAIAVGLLIGAVIILAEIRLRRISLKRLIGAAIGSVLGILGAFLMSQVMADGLRTENLAFLQISVLLAMWFLGLIVGAAKGEALNLNALGGLFGGDQGSRKSYKILDTSVIIDGRIADVAETGFAEGVIVVPQFVLWELQLVADSADPLKRNRGRRGLDILQRIQKMSNLEVKIVEDDYPKIKEVDLKLIELAKGLSGKIVTNDFNLNKLAQLQGIEVLNLNELANSLKPVVLPGETMRVFILKEGKEHNQGVAYLDDGTMVVVDNARRQISKTVEITVTSVLQTTAGKMIFGRYDEKSQQHSASDESERLLPIGKGSSSPHKFEQTVGR
jgi:uncharacterized protein YacL